jgi:sialate O-acetylesterase
LSKDELAWRSQGRADFVVRQAHHERKWRKKLKYFLALTAFAAAPAMAAPSLSPVWTDHAVIQRDRPVVVDGTARPGETVHGMLGDASATAKAAKDGSFTLTFPARPASSEPISLGVSGVDDAVTTVSDLLVGDVWLCGGQSNMEFSTWSSAGGPLAAQQSQDDGLRLLMIPKVSALTPQKDFGGKVAWAAAAPDSVKDFSGACYFMARQLRKDLKVPIGAIHSNWGGSQIRAWVTPVSGAKLYGAPAMAQLGQYAKDPLAAVTAFAPGWEQWWTERDHQSPWDNPDALAWQPVPQISAWGEWAGTPLATNGNGNVWMRRTVTLTPEQAKAGGTLNIGLVDDIDMTFVNGHPVGNTSSWSDERHYRVPASYLKPGANEVMVLVTNSYGAGGMESKPDRLSFDVAGGASVPLGDGWRYSISKVTDYPPRSPWDGIAGIGVMHNRMIAPFGHFALAGGAWYQGESDVGIPGYADRLRELIAGWRQQFNPNLRMLVVQLPNWGPTTEHPTASGWAEIRNEEFKAVAADSNAALVPTLDVGENSNLHPLDKLDVGLRLALAAEGKSLPLPTSAKRQGDAVVVAFSGIGGGLHTWSSGHAIGVELCGATQESCRYAPATVSGNALSIADDGKPATRVRYAWIDSPVVNLYDARALPVPGFELPITQ